ncbi:phospholipase D-like domain-containing protein (plasmid) [Mycobacterium sp. Aquia_216]|uniref:phospholipase D-like domain-containing protein n=1 Tax=Mycobacterium sp. Aquia_216 TaxID=2991729 RepID=UPI00227D4C37|nr:phospholipase D-like domain-containing protein [Mycobacterium sp. Aquia_216]WAJ48028.1 phospholipase D-like domain-containing protein [Mycobacterium sp. Aquia_216]
MPVHRSHAAAAVAAAAAVISACAGCGINSAAGSTHLSATAASATGTYRLIQEPDAGYQPITDMIGAATQSVRLAMYELSDDAVVHALVDAKRQRHVEVHVLLDAAFHGRQTNQAAFTELQQSAIDVTWAPADVIYHEKLLVIDDTSAVIGTANLVHKYYRSSRDAFVVTTAPADVAATTATFDADYAAAHNAARSTPTATAGEHLVWSPAAERQFVDQIATATTSLNITSEEFIDAPVLSAIAHTARRGVACRVVLTEDPAWNPAINEVSAAGCSVHLLPRSASALYMHEKLLLIDAAALIIGSHNLSPASLRDNRELSLRLDQSTAPSVLAAAASTFEHDYQQAVPATSSER